MSDTNSIFHTVRDRSLINDLELINFYLRNRNMAFLKIAVDPAADPELVTLYKEHIIAHNRSLIRSNYPNSGFDVFVAKDEVFTEPFATKMVNLQIKLEMTTYTVKNEDNVIDTETPTAFYSYPRSSLSKTPLMLANHTGIIDSGYRGNLIGAFRMLSVNNDSYTVPKFTRLLQICHPALYPIFVELVDESELSTTERGEGGFGSTGRSGSMVGSGSGSIESK